MHSVYIYTESQNISIAIYLSMQPTFALNTGTTTVRHTVTVHRTVYGIAYTHKSYNYENYRIPLYKGLDTII